MCNIKSITYCGLCMLNSICLEPLLVDFTGAGPLTGENLLGPSASASLYFQFARYPKEKAFNAKNSLTCTEWSLKTEIRHRKQESISTRNNLQIHCLSLLVPTVCCSVFLVCTNFTQFLLFGQVPVPFLCLASQACLPYY